MYNSNNNNINSNNRNMMVAGSSNGNKRTSNIDAPTGGAAIGADDSTNFTTGDESSMLLRVGRSASLTGLGGVGTTGRIGIDKKNSEGSGYHFGNSSVGGSSSVLRPGISYNPTVNTNYNNSTGVGRRGMNSGLGNGTTHSRGYEPNNNTEQSSALRKYFGNFCGVCSVYDLQAEKLEYNYALEAAEVNAATSSGTTNNSNSNNTATTNTTTTSALPGKTPADDSNSIRRRRQPLPRIRARGEYYIDTFNDEPWSWTMGTNEANGTWCNSSDQAGTIMSAMVWILLLYSAFTVTALTITEGIPVGCGMLYSFFVFMSLASHAKTSFTDPGSVPIQAIPSERQRLLRDSHSMCGQCQTFKPPGSHHCRICNRCIGRMDHHCPWMNNCVGAGNLKHFCLFLIYTWLCAAYSLSIFGWNYFFCSDEDCTFHPLVLHLVRLMTLLAIGAFLFTSSMLMNVCYGIMTGIGTIDRLKKKATNTMSQSDEEPIQLIDVFGIGGYWTWLLPFLDPVFDDYDRVMGYTIPSRLDRERQFCDLYVAQQIQLQQQKSQQQNGNGGPPQLLTGNIITTTTKNRSGNSTSNSNAVKSNASMDFPGKCVNDLLPV